jgi:hypothetical protein
MKQKDFRFVGVVATSGSTPAGIESFLVTFFQKSNFFAFATPPCASALAISAAARHIWPQTS